MRKPNTPDEWVNLLMDSDLTHERRAELEALLEKNPDADTLSTVRRARLISRLLQEIGKEKTPGFDNADRMWSRVHALITEEIKAPLSWTTRLDNWLTPPVWGLALAGCLAIAVGLWFLKDPQESQPAAFGKILNVYSFKPEVSATAYESRTGNATIIWLSGLFEDSPAQFGQIWQIYSFTPEVTATSYDSPAANATIIWLSGIDEESASDGRTSS